MRPTHLLLAAGSIALALGLAARAPSPASAVPGDRSLREYRDPVTRARVQPPRIAPTFDTDPIRPGGRGPMAPAHDDGPAEWRSGTYPERTLDELAKHNLRAHEIVTVLPTSQSYDRGEIAVIEDDGTILVPLGNGQVELDPAALAARFLELHNDEYDYVTVWMASNLTNLTLGGGAFAYELNVRNEVEGLGLSIFDFSDDFGSNGVIRSFLNMNRLSRYPDDPNQTFLGTNSMLNILGQEAGHRFGAFTWFERNGTLYNSILGRSLAHWSFFFNSLASDLEGNRIRENGGNSFTTIDATNGSSFLDEYLYGLRDSSEVDTLWYVDGPTNLNPPIAYEPSSQPTIGVSFDGLKTPVTISQIVAANGLRVPTPATSQKTFRMAWVLVIRNGDTPTAADLFKLENFRGAWGPYFASAVDGLGTFDNTVNSIPGTVAIEHVPLKDTESSAARTVDSDMSIHQKSVLIPFDNASPRLHWRANGGAWNQVALAQGAGNQWSGSIPGQPAGTVVDYWLSAASTTPGITGALPATAPAQFYTYRVGIDVTLPTLAHDAPADPSYLQMPLPVVVDAFDNLGLDSVAVTWRINSGPLQTAVQAAVGDGPYTFAIGAGAGFGDVVTYRFSAVDRAAAKNRALDPPGSSPHALLVGANFAETFEAGEGGFAHSALSINFFDQWHRSTARNATPGGGWSWKCGSTGNTAYGSKLHAGLISAPIMVGPNAILRFQHWYDLESSNSPPAAYDGARVQISNDDGANWSTITPQGGYPNVIVTYPDGPFPAGTPVWSGESGSFAQATFDLSSPTVHPVRLRFVLGTDSFVGGEGWYVDDVTMTYDGGQPVGVPLAPTSFALLPPTPNPSRTGRTTFSWALPQASTIRLALYDARGRLVRSLIDGARPAGPAFVDWDGRDERGQAVAAGLYFARLDAGGLGVRTTRLVVVR